MIPDYLQQMLEKARVFDLGQPIYPGMPHHPNQPPFGYVLLKKHGDIPVGDQEISFCNDLFMMGGHTGTHLDAVGHVAVGNRIHEDTDITKLQDYQNGLQTGSIAETAPIVRRGVMLDIPRVAGTDVLDHEFAVGETEMQAACEDQGVEIQKGDVVLVRTGWIRYWTDRQKYLSVRKGVPGVVESGARFLATKQAGFVGSDTTAFEKVPPHHLPCHVILLKENAIQIMEMLNLEEMAEAGVYTFVFVALPLKIRGGAGSPIRPVAIA